MVINYRCVWAVQSVNEPGSECIGCLSSVWVTRPDVGMPRDKQHGGTSPRYHKTDPGSNLLRDAAYLSCFFLSLSRQITGTVLSARSKSYFMASLPSNPTLCDFLVDETSINKQRLSCLPSNLAKVVKLVFGMCLVRVWAETKTTFTDGFNGFPQFLHVNVVKVNRT